MWESQTIILLFLASVLAAQSCFFQRIIPWYYIRCDGWILWWDSLQHISQLRASNVSNPGLKVIQWAWWNGLFFFSTRCDWILLTTVYRKKQRLPQNRRRCFKCVNVSACVDKRLSWILTLKRCHAPLVWAPWKIMTARSRWDPSIKGGTRTVLFALNQYYDVHWCVQFTSWVKFSWNKQVIQKAGWNVCVSERSSGGISEVFTNNNNNNKRKLTCFAPLALWRIFFTVTNSFNWMHISFRLNKVDKKKLPVLCCVASDDSSWCFVTASDLCQPEEMVTSCLRLVRS